MLSRRMVVVGLAALSHARPASAQDTVRHSLSNMVDRIVQRGLQRYEIAGAAVVVVHHDTIRHRRGYGVANIESRRPVDPESTVFHVASVTKLFTAIAALQLVDERRLSLDSDVRSALSDRLPSRWTSPVTLRQLLTHTAALETRWIGMAAPTPEQVRPLSEYVPTNLPPLRGVPDSTIRYSNHGYAAAGLLIERAAGAPWAEVIEQRVFAPLQMTSSYARPRMAPPTHAIPYRYRQDTMPEPQLFEHVSPGGAAHSTASDIGKLLIALLADSSSLGLSVSSKSLVLAPAHRVGGVEGYALGMFRFPHARISAMSMGGELPGFSTRILVVPEQKFGMVVMVNRKDPLLAVSLFDSVLVALAPGPAPMQSTHRKWCVDSTRFDATPITPVGRYRSNLQDRSTFLRIGEILGPVLTVAMDTGGFIRIANPIDDSDKQWAQIAPNSWMSSDGECFAIAGEDANRVVLTTQEAGPIMLERVEFLALPSTTPLIAAASMAILLICLLVAAWKSARRAWSNGGERRLLALVLVVTIGHFIFMAFYATGLYQLAIGFDDRFAFGIPAWYNAALHGSIMLLLVTLWLAIATVKGSARRYRVLSFAAVMASAGMLLVLYCWRALPPSISERLS